jgi:hypothetical protein
LTSSSSSPFFLTPSTTSLSPSSTSSPSATPWHPDGVVVMWCGADAGYAWYCYCCDGVAVLNTPSDAGGMVPRTQPAGIACFTYSM